VSLIAEMVIANLGCTIHPIGAFRRAVAGGMVVCRRIVDPPMSRTLYLCYSRRVRCPGRSWRCASSCAG